jgi:hypothetical protein
MNVPYLEGSKSDAMPPIFEESQRFNQWWIYLVPVSAVLFSVYVTYEQLWMQRPVGNNPLDNDHLWIMWLFTLSILALIAIVRLDTQINNSGIHVRLRPFTSAYFSWDQIEQAYLRKYKPLREFGGYGLRFSRSGKAYNIKGDEGLQLVLKNGKQVLIGTQKWDELEKTLEKMLGSRSRSSTNRS